MNNGARPPRVGEGYRTRVSDPDYVGVILEVRPYTGRYTEYYTHIVRFTSPEVTKGWIELSWGPNQRSLFTEENRV